MHQFDTVTARLIVVLAQCGSIGRAAERENIATSAVSRRISDLEARLGVVLFDRSAQGVRLTSAGEAYVEGCRSVLREVADLETAMTDFATGRRGSLRLACTSSALSGRLPELLVNFAAQHPTIALDIQEMPATASLAALEDGLADLAVVSDNNDFSRFEIKPFEDDRIFVIASPDHPLASDMGARKELAFAAVMGHEVVGFHHSGALDRLLTEAAAKAGQTLGERVKVETFPSLVRMVEAGFGIGFLRSTSLHLLASTDLVSAALSDEWAMRKLLVARRKTSPLSKAVRAFVTLCADTYAPMK